MSQNNRYREPSDAEPGNKREKESKPQSRSKMEVASYVAGLTVVVLGLASAVFVSVGHRDIGLWTTCAAIIAAIVGGCCWYQDLLWKKDDTGNKPSEPVKRDQRARVILSNIESDPATPEAGKVFRVIITFKNIGPTPAKKCRGYFVIEPVESGSSPNFSYVNNRLVQMGAFAPASEQRAILNPMIDKSTGAPGPMTQEVLKQLTNSTIRLVTHGRVDYEDVFGDEHWFTFCMTLGFPQNPNFAIWPEHNDSDD